MVVMMAEKMAAEMVYLTVAKMVSEMVVSLAVWKVVRMVE